MAAWMKYGEQLFRTSLIQKITVVKGRPISFDCSKKRLKKKVVRDIGASFGRYEDGSAEISRKCWCVLLTFRQGSGMRPVSGLFWSKRKAETAQILLQEAISGRQKRAIDFSSFVDYLTEEDAYDSFRREYVDIIKDR